MKRTLNEIADWLGLPHPTGGTAAVTGVSIDTRTLNKGDLFIPFKGDQADGHRFVRQAFDKGAAATLWQKGVPGAPEDVPVLIVEDPEQALQQMARRYRGELDAVIIGITGSNGKTSTKDLVAGTLSPYFRVRKTEGNYNNQLGLPLTILSLPEDTEYAVLEMGMSGFGEISFLSALARPKYAVITNIGEAHMQDLGSREGIAKAKSEITDGLQPDGKLFYDGDEPLLGPHVETLPESAAVPFGEGETCSLRLLSAEPSEAGSIFRTTGLAEGEFMIPVLGAHQAKNALAAILIGREAGLTDDQIREALKSVELTGMRMQTVEGPNGSLFINDAYNAAPTSVRAALGFVRSSALRNEKWVVLGDMLELGALEVPAHEGLAEELDPADFDGVCLYGPRMAHLFRKLEGKFPADRLVWSGEDLSPITGKLQSRLGHAPLILLKGSRGMALERIIGELADTL
ncbi:UDP-N-acetylmuramoyl-tripeptide--D-alanyl-D-alanine ligase [Bhargavaea beijingensis]|uniref:UDP-N-acetylmuramoyl-tripeptide--D-alanyl-D-alanine ligase n=1 Tax=Bhargavaea beijingensis TaxID=426756 RepID=A0A1G7F7Y7_9BACL|nr:UDP-N-acetylmuramoyl-tripeptide--D-alanyl-D-alanine ligase [Bhargavaea beijingensis]MCW1927673.1 UDP-N-acetylmuramoyl-tripeptide--D-alanyl-D-alanine ligase [Bhargavaea beijingensis]SDE71946.1 UDP-N-acetylmuramoyl-tripeptide--D-alanyl-D-alanine ligase [Bhargavaea beijingensis]